MKKFTTLPLALVLLLLSIFFLPISQCRATNLIQQTCKKTPNYDLCVSTLRSDSRSSNSDVVGLALIMVDFVGAKAKETMKNIKLLLNKNPGNKKKALSSCADNYRAVIEGDIPEAIQALKTGDYKFAEQGTNDVSKEADSCEDNFQGSYPLTNMNKLVHDLASIAAAITRVLLIG
ncbi:hypothetical protein UlMin_009204 [Ulmus minor]